jgi:hypothetical protein
MVVLSVAALARLRNFVVALSFAVDVKVDFLLGHLVVVRLSELG